MQLSTYPTKKFTAENRVLLTADDTTSNCHFRWPVPPAYYTVRRSTDPSQSTFSGVMNSILITGCNRGLGLGLVKSLAKLPKPPQHIFATCRDAEQAVELKQFADSCKNVHILQIDLLNFEAYDNLLAQVSSIVGDKGLNVLINNAGVAPKSVRINMTNQKDIINTLTTNVVVPIMFAKACIPLLQKASEINGSKSMGVERAAIINMSSILGSIEANTDGGLYAYRTSKAALNAATKSLSIDLSKNKILCMSMHPGWVKTDMGGKNAPLDVETSCGGMVKTIMELNESHNGGFYQYDGKKLPW